MRELITIKYRGSNYTMRGTRYIDRQTMRIAHRMEFGIDTSVRDRMDYFCEMRRHMEMRRDCAIRDRQCDYCRDYQNGKVGPQGGMYNLPAIPVRVGWMPSGTNEKEGVPYVYISSMYHLTTYWSDGEIVEERMFIVRPPARLNAEAQRAWYRLFGGMYIQRVRR